MFVTRRQGSLTLDRSRSTPCALLPYPYPYPAAEPALLEEDLFPESGLPVPRPAPKNTPPDGGNSSLGKRGREGAAADTGGASCPPGDMAVDDPAPNAGVSEEDAPDRRTRPHAAAAMETVDGTNQDIPSESSQEWDAGGTAGRGITEDERMAATMAAIAKESSASVGSGVQRDSHSPDSDEEGREGSHGALTGRGREGGVGVDSVVQDVMRLARSLKAARPSMSSEQLEEVDSLLRQTLKDVREREDEEE